MGVLHDMAADLTESVDRLSNLLTAHKRATKKAVDFLEKYDELAELLTTSEDTGKEDVVDPVKLADAIDAADNAADDLQSAIEAIDC